MVLCFSLSNTPSSTMARTLVLFMALLMVTNITSVLWVLRRHQEHENESNSPTKLQQNKRLFHYLKHKKQTLLESPQSPHYSPISLNDTLDSTASSSSSSLVSHFAFWSSTDKNDPRNRKIVVAGLAQDTDHILPSTWDFLMTLSCQHNAIIHIIAQVVQPLIPTDQTANPPLSNPQHESTYQDMFCAPFYLEQQDQFMTKEDFRDYKVTFQHQQVFQENNRLIRLAQVRDAHRHRVEQLFFSHNEPNREQLMQDSAVVVMDLDLFGMPSVSSVMHRAHNMEGMDAVCAFGVEKGHEWPPFRNIDPNKPYFYDTFALVNWPDTYAYPKEGRLFPYNYPTENMRLKQDYGIPDTDWDDWGDLLQVLAKQHPSQMAPVRSCFGGLAMYRASTWLTRQCQHDLYGMIQKRGRFQPPPVDFHLSTRPRPLLEVENYLRNNISYAKNLSNGHELNILRYASGSEKMVCEHIVFHDCLHRTVFTDNRPHMAVDPKIITQWVNGAKGTKQPNYWNEWQTPVLLVGVVVSLLLMSTRCHRNSSSTKQRQQMQQQSLLPCSYTAPPSLPDSRPPLPPPSPLASRQASRKFSRSLSQNSDPKRAQLSRRTSGVSARASSSSSHD